MPDSLYFWILSGFFEIEHSIDSGSHTGTEIVGSKTVKTFKILIDRSIRFRIINLSNGIKGPVFFKIGIGTKTEVFEQFEIGGQGNSMLNAHERIVKHFFMEKKRICSLDAVFCPYVVLEIYIL